MENYGCVTWSDSFIFRDPPTYAEREVRALVLLHEMAHMWFGDIVTMRWWDDLWLNEAFAEWACRLVGRACHRVHRHVGGMLATEKQDAYAADAGADDAPDPPGTRATWRAPRRPSTTSPTPRARRSSSSSSRSSARTSS